MLLKTFKYLFMFSNILSKFIDELEEEIRLETTAVLGLDSAVIGTPASLAFLYATYLSLIRFSRSVLLGRSSGASIVFDLDRVRYETDSKLLKLVLSFS